MWYSEGSCRTCFGLGVGLGFGLGVGLGVGLGFGLGFGLGVRQKRRAEETGVVPHVVLWHGLGESHAEFVIVDRAEQRAQRAARQQRCRHLTCQCTCQCICRAHASAHAVHMPVHMPCTCWCTCWCTRRAYAVHTPCICRAHAVHGWRQYIAATAHLRRTREDHRVELLG